MINSTKIQYYEHTCLCGCGGKIQIRKIHKYTDTPKYLRGHNKANLGKEMAVQQKNKISEIIKEQYKKGRKKSSSAFKNGSIPWNKGLNKESNAVLKIISEKQKGKKQTEKSRQKMSIAKIGTKRTEEAKHKASETMKENYRTGKMSPYFKGKVPWNKDKKCPEISEKMKGENNPMYGRIGELNPNWNNGSSFEPYGIGFNKEFKQSILERDNYECRDPNCLGNSEILHIHHIDYDKKNNNSENLTTLCNSCHSKTVGKNRQYWTEFYQNIMIERKLIDILV